MLDFDGVQEGKQRVLLETVAPRVWAREDVRAMWVVGSLARGNADAHSDVDLWVAVASDAYEDWREPDWRAFLDMAVLGRMFLFAGGAMIHSLLLETGDFFDFCVMDVGQEVSPMAMHVLGCRDADFEKVLVEAAEAGDQPLPQADREAVERMVTTFWMMTHKHRKVLSRGQDLLSRVGISQERSNLLNLWYTLETGEHVRAGGATINTLTKITRVAEAKYGDAVRDVIVGKPLETRADICRAIEGIRDVMSDVGRRLAEKYGFDYPEALEETVRRHWAEFRA